MIGKRKGRYYAKAYLGKEDGKDQWKWLGTFDTRKEAKDAERNFDRRRRPAREETCDSFANRWMDDYPRAAPGSVQRYKAAAKRFAKEFRGVPLADVDRVRARAWALEVPTYAVDGVRAMFTDALNDGLVLANPFTGLRLKRSRGRKDIRALTEDELHALAHQAELKVGVEFASLIIVAGYTGMRAGELCALEWRQINDGLIVVDRAFDAAMNLGPPKNGKTRTIVCPPKALEALDRIPRYLGDDLVFHTRRGSRLSVHRIKDYMKHSLKAPITFHELRHCCATMLLEKGVQASDVAHQLGHTDGGRLVQTLYGHPAEEGIRDRLKSAWTEPTPLRTVADQSQEKVDSA